MKFNSIIFLAIFATAALALPWNDQIALVNSLEVGRDEDPTVWACTGCEDANRPISTYVIEEPVEAVKAILSVYEEYTVLAFRYTANLKNVLQDLLWAFQVLLSLNLGSRRARM